ncbi:MULTISPECIES: MBL fold metallo-hydrolase [Cupriavidus]|uniref:MBL fold metallo-hydrolase n=1 Tax=Cupriavidus oxalaticus TaxID=96344 RepID=A0A4P7LFG4_9BURK|nr:MULTISPECIES: MBL fold metallo-hydrolase [Cupriavidus]MBF6989083.1 MBL fold metallo-hydrolase [Cupriavidus sp. IK-TO18]QBY54800.1 MBL fold metallo-hydrolase [Cupriavidus oxalaticus]TDF60237.1 MBL fold metallo-hydrolase [Cupriavidus sp. L7L]
MPALPALPDTMRVFERGWLSANNILFVDGDETALVDTGYVTHAPQTVALVASALQGRPLVRILNTHLHSDHCGGNAALQARWQPRTAIPAAEAAAVAAWDTEALTYRATGQQCDRFGFDSVLHDGDAVTLGGIDWQVVAAPGHDPHAVMLFAPGPRILISGDALWENGFGVIFPELDGESGFTEQAAVLARIAELDARLVIPGHGPMFTDVDAAVERATARLRHLSADPARNASHAVKVLVKFKLLEQQRMAQAELARWMAEAPLMVRIRDRFMPGQEMAGISAQTVRALVGAGALAVEGEWVVNRD